MHVLISTIVLGTIYALLAFGFSLIWGVARIINLSYASFYMLAAYLFHVFAASLHLNVLLAAVLSVAAATLAGAGAYKLLLERVRARETAVLLISICLAFFLEEVLRFIFGPDFRRVPPLISGYREIGGVRILNQNFLALGVGAMLIAGLWIFLSKSRTGVAIRATAQDREMVNVLGISDRKVSLAVMFIGMGCGTISSVLVSPLYVVEPLMWMHPMIIVLAVVVLGGLGSVKGTILAAYLLAFSETAVVAWVPMGAFVKCAFALAVMVVVLLMRPEGFFGMAFEEERL